MGMDDGEPVEVVAGGFGGAIGGGFRKDKSFGSTEGGFGAGIEGGCMVARSRVFKSPRKSGGGGIHSLGGGGGATEGGGGTNISPLSRLGTEVMEPLDNGSQPTEPLVFGPLTGGRRGTFGIGTAKPWKLSDKEAPCFTVGLARTLAVPDSGVADDPRTNSTLSISCILTLVSNRE